MQIPTTGLIDFELKTYVNWNMGQYIQRYYACL